MRNWLKGLFYGMISTGSACATTPYEVIEERTPLTLESRAFGDVDNDGYIDQIVVTRSSDPQLAQVRIDRMGKEIPTQSLGYVVVGQTYLVTVADVNGDGRLDISVQTYSPERREMPFNLLNQGNGRFTGAFVTERTFDYTDPLQRD